MGTNRQFIVFDKDPHIAKMVRLYCPHDNVTTVNLTSDELTEIHDFQRSIDMFIVDWNFKGRLSGSAFVN